MSDNLDSPGKPDRVPWTGGPHAQEFEKLDRVPPEARAWLLAQMEKEWAHRRRLRWADRVLYALGALLGGGSAAAYVWVAVYFVNHHAPTQGAAILGGGAASMAGLFLGSKFRKRP